MVFSRHPAGKPCFEYRFAIPVPNDAGEFASLGAHDRRETRVMPTKIYSVFRTRKPETPRLMDFVVAICLRVFADVVILHLIAVGCRTRILRIRSRNVNPHRARDERIKPIDTVFPVQRILNGSHNPPNNTPTSSTKPGSTSGSSRRSVSSKSVEAPSARRMRTVRACGSTIQTLSAPASK